MLTGDHPLTAVSIAYSCGLIDKDFKNIIITSIKFDEICKQIEQVIEESANDDVCLVITGDSFGVIQKNMTPSFKKHV